VVAEAPAQDAKRAGLVAEPAGRLGRRGAGREIGPQRLVLALAGVRRFDEEPFFFRYRMWCLVDTSYIHHLTFNSERHSDDRQAHRGVTGVRTA